MLSGDMVLTCSLAVVVAGCSPVGGPPINLGGGVSDKGGTSGGSGSGGVSGGAPKGGTIGIPLSVGSTYSGEDSSGGNGGGLPGGPPSQEDNCGSQTENTRHQLVDMLLVLDRSGSMLYSFDKDCYCDEATARAQGGTGRNLNVCKETAGCTSRWASVSSALNVSVTATPFVRWGLKFYATPNLSECGVSSEVEIPVGEGNAAEIQAKILGTKPGNHTPTAAGITKATAYLKALASDNPKVILLATDGIPNCYDDNKKQNEDDSEATKAAIESAYQAGIPTYVIGIGPSTGTDNLNDFAAAGHTNKHYPATSPQALQDALNAIGTAVVSCTFTLNELPPDEGNVAVYVDKNLVEKDDANGWSFGGDQKTIVLNGSVCEKIKGAKAATVQVLLGCKIPPSIIP